jgi:L-asparaginase II
MPGGVLSGVRVDVTRGGTVESVHHVDLAVASATGTLVARAGEVDTPVFTRSAIKPFQALPLVDDGVAGRLGLTDPELAVCCASHSGEPRHVALARSILGRAGLDETALACGPHVPFDRAAAGELRQAGQPPGRVHNNCSGKHAGMLALAVAHGWPTRGYQRPDHPVQARMAAELARWAGVREQEMLRGVDGCGVVTFALPLSALAAAMARLVAAAAGGHESASRIVGAMRGNPFELAGTERLCTRLLEVTGGRVLAKVGAEGVYVAASTREERAVALKVRDGARRAAEVSLLGSLESLGMLAPGEVEALARWSRPVVRNTRGEAVGEIRAFVDLEVTVG